MFVPTMRQNSQTPNTMKSLAIVLVFGFQGIVGIAETTFSCDKKAELNKLFSITCRITGTIEKGIQWTRPDDTPVSGCTDTISCLSFVSGYSITTATSSENILNIANVGDMDFGKWTCHDGPGGDMGCEVVVQKTPVTAVTILSKQKIYSVGDTLEVSVDVQDYYCSRTPSFSLLLDNQRVELDTLNSTELDIHSGIQTKSITVTEDMTGSTKLVFNCRDDDVLFNEKTFEIQATTTELPTSTPARDCRIILAIIIIIIIVIKVLAFIILLIVIICLKGNSKVIQVLYIVDVIFAVAAIIGGIVCLAVAVTEMTTCEGSICNMNLGLSITCLVIGLVNLVFIIFFLGLVMDKADVNNSPLAGHFCAFPRKKDDKPTRGENSPTNATVVDIGVANSENSRGNDNPGTPKNKSTKETKFSSLVTHEKKNEDDDKKVDKTNIRPVSLRPIPSSEKRDKGDGHEGQTGNANSKFETDNAEKEKVSKQKKKTKKKQSKESEDGSRSPPTVSASGVDVDDQKIGQKIGGKPEEQLGSLSKLTGVESPE